MAEAALKAPVCLAHTQLEYARMLGSDSDERAIAAGIGDEPRRRGWGCTSVLRRADKLGWG